MESWGREEFTAMEEMLADALRRKQQGQPPPLPPPSFAFHDLNVLAFHPQQLCDEYSSIAEGGHVYFFSPRELPWPDPGNGGGETARPPSRTTEDGGIWKACGGASDIVDAGGVSLGQKVTLVFYASGSRTRSDWGMDEYTTPGNLGPGDLCLRRVYRRDERWQQEQRRRSSSPAVREMMLQRYRSRLLRTFRE